MACKMLAFGLIFSYLTVCSSVPDSYLQRRNQIINGESQQRLGHGVKLSNKELSLDSFLLKQKQTTIEESRTGSTLFPPSVNFFQSKKVIDDSPIYKMIRKMPKGCILHIHDSSLTSLDWVIQNVTYRDNLYICYNKFSGKTLLHFFEKAPVNKGVWMRWMNMFYDSDCYWEEVGAVRKRYGNAKEFDTQLYNNLTIIVDNPQDAYQSVNEVWQKFSSYFNMLNGMFEYAPVFRDYLQQGLQEMYEDNVQCAEIRALLPQLYELNGTLHDLDYTVQVYKDVSTDFSKRNPDFLGVKLIFSGVRFTSVDSMLDKVKTAMRLVKAYPDFVVGYDLVGQEGTGKPLLYYIDDLLYPSQQDPPFKLPYFFHSGETDWQNTQVDYNLIDAILLNTSRVGHGFALTKHPYIVKLMETRGIAVEVNPISNQVLELVKDLRSHPAAALMTGDFPVVVSSDDPGVWGATPLSHDFYMAFMALCGGDDGLRVIKQLAINSIRYSAMTDTEKMTALSTWNDQWSKFITGTGFDDGSTLPTKYVQIIG